MRHGVIIVHGVGQHKPFETLMGFATGFVDTMYDLVQASKAKGDPEDLDFRVELDPEEDESKDNYIEVAYHPAGKKDPDVFRIKEAHWAEVFQPHSWLRVFLWLLRSLWPKVWTPGVADRVLWVWVDRVLMLFMLFVVIIPGVPGILVRLAWLLVPLARLIEHIQWAQPWVEGFFQSLAWAGQWLKWAGRLVPWLPPTTPEPTWRWLPVLLFLVMLGFRTWRYVVRRIYGSRFKPKDTVEATRLQDRIDDAFNRALLLLMFLVAFLILSGAWVVGLLPDFPGKGVLQGVLGRIARFLVVESVGDLEVYMSDTLVAAQIRQVVEETITYFTLEDVKKGEEWRKGENGWKADKIHVIGHSLGSVICFEVLTRTLPKKIQKQVSTFFSAGSVLDKMKWFFTSRPDPKALESMVRGTGLSKQINLFQQRVALASTENLRQGYDYRYRFAEDMPDYIPWHNIRATHDPACGEITKETWFKFTIQTIPTDVVVTNVNSVFGDHSAYWRKSSQALLFILLVIWLKKKPYKALEEIHRHWV